MRNRFYKFLLFILTFMMIIPIQLNILGFVLKITLIAITVMSVIGIMYYLKKRKIEKLELHIIMYLVFLLLYVTINSLFHGLLDTQLINMMIFAILLFIAFMMLGRIYKYIYKESFDIKLLKSVVMVGIVHALFMIFSLINPELLYSFINVSEVSKTLAYTGLRTPGLFYENFAIISVFYALLFTISVLIYSKSEDFFYMFFISTILLISIGLSGRSGFLIVVLGLFILIVGSFFNKNLVSKNNLLRILFMYIFTIIFLLFFILDFNNLGNNFEWILEPLIQLMFEGSLRSESTDILFGSMYFLPENEIDSILGMGNFGRSQVLPNIDSDSGYILFIHGGGILGLIIFFSIYFYFMYIFYKYSQDIKVKFMGIFLIITILIGNIKDMYYFGYTSGWVALLFIALSILILKSKHLNNIQKCRS